MPQTTTFLAGEGFTLTTYSSGSLAGNGLGFYNATGFGGPVPIGQWQSRTYIVDPSGLSQIAEADNCKYVNPTGVTLGQTGTLLGLASIPNYQSTVTVRATFDTPVKTTNARLYVFDGIDASNLTAPPVGVRTAVYEVSHLSTSQTPVGSGGPGTPTISGSHGWIICEPSVAPSGIPCTASPGSGGARPSGANTVDTVHDWFFALSASPTSAGSKRWGLAFTYDYV